MFDSRQRPTAIYLCLSLAGSACIANLAAAGLAKAQELASPTPERVVMVAPAATPRPLATADFHASASTLAAAPTAHANAEHPAVQQWRRARAGQLSLDTDHFLVQPPASTQWARQSAP